MENMFDAVDVGGIGIVSQVCKTLMEFCRVTNRIALYRRQYIDAEFPLNSLPNASPRQIFEWAALDAEVDDFACAGAIVCDLSGHADVFRHLYVDLDGSTQPVLKGLGP